MNMDIDIEPLVVDDGREVLKLLSEAELPTEDLTTEKLQNFLVARRQDGTVIGAVGIEIKQDAGLTRSLVVHPDHRKGGLGKLLANAIESFAQEKGVKTLYLLTTTAEKFFLGLGYQVTLRETVPKTIADTEEFEGICPSSSVCLYKKFTIA